MRMWGLLVVLVVVYLRAMQPWRTISYAIGAICLVAMAVLTLVTVLG